MQAVTKSLHLLSTWAINCKLSYKIRGFIFWLLYCLYLRQFVVFWQGNWSKHWWKRCYSELLTSTWTFTIIFLAQEERHLCSTRALCFCNWGDPQNNNRKNLLILQKTYFECSSNFWKYALQLVNNHAKNIFTYFHNKSIIFQSKCLKYGFFSY